MNPPLHPERQDDFLADPAREVAGQQLLADTDGKTGDHRTTR